MDIIIDGYNLIGSEQGLRGTLEHKRHALVQQLERYHKAKGFFINLVFDGWKAGQFTETCQKANGVTVIFSRQGEKADDVVVRMARQRGSGCVVVSSDREVRNSVEKFGASALYAGEFCEILRQLDTPGRSEIYPDSDSDPSRDGVRFSKSERRRRDKLKRLRVR
ncbi:MAG TPA: NYN domain-containing protein [Candidatus Binatia bacterium]|nr:NYN domain-containing protein [Candidatus Binatia bacterium]